LTAPISIPVRVQRARALKWPAFAAMLATSLACLLPGASHAMQATSALQVQLTSGVIEGARMQAGDAELRVFKGIPYAAPPVGTLRWKEPQPVAQWSGVRQATQFGPRCMQLDFNQKMRFRSDSMSEDCLFLNVWTPARAHDEKLPVLVYFHGGGFHTGDGSEPRFDGANLAARGIVTVTVNYRLGVFGFLALRKLALESPYDATGNYGLLDQMAALAWVHQNIAQFGGDPKQVTIAGQASSATAVGAHMASPLSRGLFARAIAESGTAFGPRYQWEREIAEKYGSQFAQRIGETSLQNLRALPAQTLLDATGPIEKPIGIFWPVVDGRFLNKLPTAVFKAGEQARVPLLLGSNSQDGDYTMLLEGAEPTPEKWRALLQRLFQSKADEALALYPGHDQDEVVHSATTLVNDVGINNQIWRWMESHRAAYLPAYVYTYTHPLPPKRDAQPNEQTATGAVHGAQVEYALGNLDGELSYAWTAEDYEVSRIFSGYIAQFVKNGDPNGRGLPQWRPVRDEEGGVPRQMIGANTFTEIAREAQRQALVTSLFNTVAGTLGFQQDED
jgi:para-nitrobenzyl esterase